ncbi:MAG: diacylglycerol kinase [Verrucomicrobiota bacterium]
MSEVGEIGSSEGGKPTQAKGFMRLIRAANHSIDGIGAALKHEAAFRQEIVLACILIPLAIVLELPVTEKVLLVGVLFFVLVTELLNTAVECCIDYISFDLHPIAKRAKDLGSAAVFLTLVFAGATWGLVLWANWPLEFLWA